MSRPRSSNELPSLPWPMMTAFTVGIAASVGAGVVTSVAYGQVGVAVVNTILLAVTLTVLVVQWRSWRFWAAHTELLGLHRDFREALLSLPVDDWQRSDAGGGATFSYLVTPLPFPDSVTTPAFHRLVVLRDEQRAEMNRAVGQGMATTTVTDEFIVGNRHMPVMLRHQVSVQQPKGGAVAIGFVDDERPLPERQQANRDLTRAGAFYPSPQELRTATEQIRSARPLHQA